MTSMEKLEHLRKWRDHPANPLICPPFPGFLLGDPSVVLPDESPDGSWHLFANTILAIQHYTSADGISWRRCGKVSPGMRAFVFKEEDVFYLFYEEFLIPMFKSRICARASKDLLAWSDRKVVLEPELKWERTLGHTVGNPCIVRHEDRYRLYYSAGLVFLPDLGFCEPLHIGLAESVDVLSGYERLPRPIISPSKEDPYRNLGAGAIKVFRDDEIPGFLGFNNGIYKDREGRTRSSILLLQSEDGKAWEYLFEKPIISPGEPRWKQALVYQLDVKRLGNELWLYYNARSGWRFGRECIGLATCHLPAGVRRKSLI